MTPIPLGILASSISGPGYWITRLYASSSAELNSIQADGNSMCVLNNEMFLIYNNSLFSNKSFYSKLNQDGSLSYTKYEDSTLSFQSIKDSVANNKIGIATQSGVTQSGLLEINPADGSRSFYSGFSYSGDDDSSSLDVDGSGNYYVCGAKGYVFSPAVRPKGFITKINSSGSIILEKGAQSALNLSFPNVNVANSGNVYAGGYFSGSVAIVKFDPSLNLQWQYRYDATGISSSSSGRVKIHTDKSSENTYATISSSGNLAIMKINSSGGLVWTKKITSSINNTNNDLGQDTFISTDGSGNIYIAARYHDTTSEDGATFIVKLNSSGTKIWEYSIRIEKNDNNRTGFVMPKSSPFYSEDTGEMFISFSARQADTVQPHEVYALKIAGDGSTPNATINFGTATDTLISATSHVSVINHSAEIVNPNITEHSESASTKNQVASSIVTGSVLSNTQSI